MSSAVLSISIDTEEDNWGSFGFHGATTRNIGQIPMLQEIFDSFGARPTYLVNHAPLVHGQSVDILGALAERSSVEIGAHCHPWNTPPNTGEGEARSMMFRLTAEENRAKIGEVKKLLQSRIGVTPTSFRAGRWGFGPTVAAAIAELGFEVDCSVSPFVDWSELGGVDFSLAPDRPYRFSPARPLVPDEAGALVQLPTTIGYLRGRAAGANRARRALERSWLSRFKLVGLLDRAGVLARRWLSPETATAPEMVRVIDSSLEAGMRCLQLTFHSCTLLPGATPFVRDGQDLDGFLRSISTVLEHCRSAGCEFETLAQVGRSVRSGGA